jgi:UDP-N-acetylglucosamine:LPS N-acetylglucosamine transferase
MSETRRRRVLVVYSRVGGGHLSAARALAEELESSGLATATIVDAYVACARFPLTLFPAAYARLARYHPRLWRMLYQATDTRLNAAGLLTPFLRPGFRRLLANERPDVVVSVLPVINGVLAQAAAEAGARFEVVLTDWHAIHRLWVAPGVDHYTTPTDSAAADCVRFGASPTAMDVVGIPVRRAFAAVAASPPQPDAGLTQPGLNPNRFTILAMVGAEGSPRALQNIARLAQSETVPNAQLLVVCGRNEDLRQRVQRLPARLPLAAVGFVDNVAELMRRADVLVTKAGGLTLAEAFCSGVPVVVYDVLPGQEAGNLAYALLHDAVVHARDPAELVRLVGELASDPARRQALAKRGSRLARPAAAETIARNVLARLLPES